MKKVKFYKEDGVWCIDLPLYLQLGGHKSHLAMVAGADTLLELISLEEYGQYGHAVYLEVGTPSDYGKEEYHIYNSIMKKSEPINISMGCTYVMGMINKYAKTFEAVDKEGTVWLCPTTLYVFDNEYPNIIYFRNITEEEYEQDTTTQKL